MLIKRIIDKQTFCKELKISENCWIFNDLGEKPKFWKEVDELHLDDTEYVFDDNNGTIRKFKLMPEYGETWIKTFGSTWNTFSVW